VPGDELICIEPAWPAYGECACFVGSTISSLRTTFEDEWNPDLKNLANMINSNTKMIVLNYPNNPTGKILEKKILDQIVSMAKDHKLYILSDEVYRDYAFNGYTSISEYGYERSIVVSSFSKGHAMTGFRIGYAISKENIIDRMAKVQATALTSVAEPMQYAALAAAEVSTLENAKRISKRLDLICERLREMSLRFVKPDGALYVFPKTGNGQSDLKLVHRALDLGVAIAPGSGFGAQYGQFIRISACQTDDKLEKGLHLLNSALRSG
jgi:aspartate aminotransferase